MNFRLKLNVCIILTLLTWLYACNTNMKPDEGDTPEHEPINQKATLYQNPVFEPVLADPTVIKSGEYFYAYGTEDNWGEEGGYHIVPVLKSSDLINWELLGDAFNAKPIWKTKGGIWAPDVSKVDGKYYMYYSYSTWGDLNPGIGLAVSDTPEGPFIDQGKVLLSKEIGVENSIDPFFIEKGENKYLFWGSFHGIYAAQLTNDGRGIVGEKQLVAANHLEAAYVYKKDHQYYLFGSSGTCCEGAESTYKVLVGRSESLLGPYFDSQSNKLTDGTYGEVVVQANESHEGFAGPGHNAEIITETNGDEWLLYHAMKKNNARLKNGTNRRSLMLDKLIWQNGWPSIKDQVPGVHASQAPVF